MSDTPETVGELAEPKPKYIDPDRVLLFTCKSLWDTIDRKLDEFREARPRVGTKGRLKAVPASEMAEVTRACLALAKISGAIAPARNEHTGKDGAPLVPEVSVDDILSRLAIIRDRAGAGEADARAAGASNPEPDAG